MMEAIFLLLRAPTGHRQNREQPRGARIYDFKKALREGWAPPPALPARAVVLAPHSPEISSSECLFRPSGFLRLLCVDAFLSHPRLRSTAVAAQLPSLRCTLNEALSPKRVYGGHGERRMASRRWM